MCFNIISEDVTLQPQQIISHGLICPLMDDGRNRVKAPAGRAARSCCRNGMLFVGPHTEKRKDALQSSTQGVQVPQGEGLRRKGCRVAIE